jgi:Holliday junction resolvase RusA-like endonuclease
VKPLREGKEEYYETQNRERKNGDIPSSVNSEFNGSESDFDKSFIKDSKSSSEYPSTREDIDNGTDYV